MKILITGGSSGIGEAIALQLHSLQRPIDITVFYLDVPTLSLPMSIPQLKVDVTSNKAIYDNYIGGLDILINCAGVNYINWLQDTSEWDWDRVMDTNAKSIFLLAKAYCDDLIRSKGTILNIVSNASHIPMTNSIAYNASKGAAHIMTLQLARELSPKGVTVFGISPNKVADTKMSEYIDSEVCDLRGWTREEAAAYQLSALPAGEETDKHTLAEFVAFLLSSKQRHKYLTGTILPYGK